jgi:DNA-binding Lrp family transcriptional regulator
MQKLSPTEQRILAATQLNARDTIASLAKQLKMPPHKVRYHLSAVQERGLLFPYILVDHFALGMQQVLFHCALANRKPADLAKTVRALEKIPGLFVLELTGGDYQFAFEVLVKEVADATKFLENLCEEFSIRIRAKAVGVCVGWTLYHRKYMATVTPRVPQVDIYPGQATVVLDPLDRKILSAVSKSPLGSTGSWAKTVGAPESTVSYRVKSLEQSGIIKCYGLSLDGAQIGMNINGCIISFADHSPKQKEKLRAFCKRHPNICSYAEFLGEWDVIVRSEFADPVEVYKLVEEIELHMSGAIQQIRTVQYLREVNVDRRIVG